MKSNYYIYITTNLLNGKKYIGKRHCLCEISNDNYLGSGKVLKNAIRKYGKNNFAKTILETCKYETTCNEREKYWINVFNAAANPMFYNIALGGEGGNTYAGLSREELDRIKKTKSLKSKGVNNPRYNAVVSDETRKKMSVKAKEYYIKTGKSPTSGKFGERNRLSIKIYCVELNKLFCGIGDASRTTKIPKPNIIRSLKSNGRLSAGKLNNTKLHWIYGEKNIV